MSDQSQITTPNLHVEAADGVAYRYRRFGAANASGPPLVISNPISATP